MSRALADLALEKRLLVAKSTLQRSQLRAQVAAVRSRASSRSALFNVFLSLAGAGRAAGWIGKAAALLGIARTLVSLVRLVKR